MPKTVIKEIDNTGVRIEDGADTVYIIAEKASGASMAKPVLCTRLSKLTSKESELASTGLGYKLAKSLLTRGIHVLYQEFASDGESGITFLEEGADLTKAIEDQNLYDIRFIVSGVPLTDAQQLRILEIASVRGDCVALLDHPEDCESEKQVEEYFSSLVGTAVPPDSAINWSNAVAVTPWYSDSEIGDSVPASFGYLIAYAESVRLNPSWFAVAGAFRGVIPTLVGVNVNYTSAEVEALQCVPFGGSSSAEPTLSFAINPISYVRPVGYVINGNRTLLVNEGATSEDVVLKATSFLNIRNLVSALHKRMFEAANRYRFEQNDDLLWVNFTSEIIPLLEQMKSDRGLNNYTITRLATDKKAQVRGRVTISPIEAVEDFDLEIELSDSTDEPVVIA